MRYLGSKNESADVATQGDLGGGGGGTGPITGEVKMWPTDTAPSGYLVCDGTEYQNSQHPDLAALLGTAFGGVAGTSFKVPDFTERFPLGAAAGGVGSAGGSKSITVANLPSHTHGPGTLGTNSTGAHTHDVHRRASTGTNVGMAQGGGAASSSGDSTSTSDGGHTHAVTTGTTAATGSDADYLPPFLRIKFIIKT